MAVSSHLLHYPQRTAVRFRHRHEHGAHAATTAPTVTSAERVLRRSRNTGHSVALATERALHYRTPGGAWRRLLWVDIAAVGWSKRTNTIWVRFWSEPNQQQTVEVPGDSMLAVTAAERIDHAHLVRYRTEILPGTVADIEAVRLTEDDEPQWRVHLPSDAVGADPHVQQACRDTVRELRSLTGC